MIAKKIQPPDDQAMRLPDHERGVGEYHISQFDRLTRKAARETDPAKRDVILDARLALELSPGLKREQEEVRAGVAESVSLAMGRGEEVQTVGDAVEITTRDGLKRLYVRERITEEEYEEGRAYRRDRDLRNSDLSSQLGAIAETGSAHDNDLFVKARLTRAVAASMIGVIDRAVAVRCAPNALNMLRWVAGDGHAISAFGDGRAMSRNVDALKAALAVAASSRKSEEERRREEAKRAAKSQGQPPSS